VAFWPGVVIATVAAGPPMVIGAEKFAGTS